MDILKRFKKKGSDRKPSPLKKESTAELLSRQEMMRQDAAEKERNARRQDSMNASAESEAAAELRRIQALPSNSAERHRIYRATLKEQRAADRKAAERKEAAEKAVSLDKLRQIDAAADAADIAEHVRVMALYRGAGNVKRLEIRREHGRIFAEAVRLEALRKEK